MNPADYPLQWRVARFHKFYGIKDFRKPDCSGEFIFFIPQNIWNTAYTVQKFSRVSCITFPGKMQLNGVRHNPKITGAFFCVRFILGLACSFDCLGKEKVLSVLLTAPTDQAVFMKFVQSNIQASCDNVQLQ